MALTDTFVRQVKPTGKPTGDKYADGGGMYLHVKAAGKYWRMSYRYAGCRRRLNFDHPCRLNIDQGLVPTF